MCARFISLNNKKETKKSTVEWNQDLINRVTQLPDKREDRKVDEQTEIPVHAQGKLVIFSAPSGSGKSTIIDYLLTQHLNLHFSISATSRAPRGKEQNGVEYYFLTPDAFRSHVAAGDFIEYEEVYKDKYYGTLRSEVDRITGEGSNVVFDVDVKGGCNIKSLYGDRALSIFIKAPNIEVLRQRLIDRATDSPEVIESRIAKAQYELSFADRFDHVVVNDDLSKAEAEVYALVSRFLSK